MTLTELVAAIGAAEEVDLVFEEGVGGACAKR
jgi:hypothetical protein